MHISEPAEYAMLGLLHSRPMHGYEMFQQFESGTMGQIIHLEMSQMYAFLKKLERMNYIEAELEPQGSRPPRKVFHITALGRETFLRWLTEPLVRPREIRILFLIKLYFVQRHMPQELTALIDREVSACRQFLDRLEARHSETSDSPASPNPFAVPTDNATTDDTAFFDHVVLRSRIYQTRSLLDWLRELQQDMRKANRL
jgi:PadR family transcriptional regulator AphA